MLLDRVESDILMVDADPATNLPDVLGVKVEKTVGMVASELRKTIDAGKTSPMTSKAQLLESWVYGTLVETPEFDLLAMGRTEGEGCYCYVNSILTRILDVITQNYDVTLMDMEAGLEHLSRRTDRDLDALIIVTDPSKMGLSTAKRIRDLAEEVHIGVREVFFVGNLSSPGMEGLLLKHAEEEGLELAGFVPYDPNVSRYNVEGRPLLDLPEDSPAVRAAEAISKEIGLTS